MDQLASLGVHHYTVDTPTLRTTFYSSANEQWVKEHPPPTPIAVSSAFDVASVKAALTRRQRQQTSYEQFMEEMGHAGVRQYEVRMGSRECVYSGVTAGDELIERVPVMTPQS